MTREIQLNHGKVTLVSDEDYDWLNQWNWYADCTKGKYWYAKRLIAGTRKKLKMHRAILNAPDGIFVDHINMDTLDNTRENLRLATRAQNQWNRSVQKSMTGFKGVVWSSRKKRWRARISVNGHRISRGLFKTPKEAAIKYNELALQLHGEFARLNVIS